VPPVIATRRIGPPLSGWFAAMASAFGRGADDDQDDAKAALGEKTRTFRRRKQ